MLVVSFVVLQLIIFAILVSVFRRIMTQNVSLATRHLEEMNSDYAEKERQLAAKMQELEEKTNEVLNKSREEAESSRLEILKEAEKDKEGIIKEARAKAEEMIEQADKSRQKLLQEVDNMVAKEAMNKACLLLQETLPEDLKRIVHVRWVGDLIQGGFSNLERLHIPEDTREAKAVSAFELSKEERQGIASKLKESLGRDISLKDEVDPKLVAGVVISVGNLVLDGSLRNKILERAR